MKRDLIGVGAGPANLSLASLLTTARERGLTSITATFFEREANVFWHSLQMFPGTLMQTEFYRDLVTPIDPTSRFSFLNYLKAQARLDQFFCSSTIYPTRREFEDYFRWVAGQIGDVIFGVAVNCVDYDTKKNVFVVDAETHGGCETKHLVFGCGGQPKSGVEESRSRRVVDVSRLLAFTFPETLDRILVVGGGQSAAECLSYLLDKFSERPVRIDWVTSETSFRALDTSNFSRETFSTAYAQVFSSLSSEARENQSGRQERGQRHAAALCPNALPAALPLAAPSAVEQSLPNSACSSQQRSRRSARRARRGFGHGPHRLD